MYENIIEKHLIILDSIRLQDLRKIHFQSVINNALKMPRTCQQIALTFRQIVKSAIQDKNFRKDPTAIYVLELIFQNTSPMKKDL